MKITLCNPDRVPFIALKHLEKAIQINPLPADPTIWDILDDARNGEGEIYVIESDRVLGAMYVEIYPEIVNVSLLGGENITEWKEELSTFLKSLMKEKGIKHLSIVGRSGWAKIFKELKPIGTLFVFST